METVKHSFLSMPIFWQARANTAMLSFAKKDPFSSCDITIGWNTGIFVEGFHLDVGKTLLHDCAENLVLTFPSVSNGSVFQCVHDIITNLPSNERRQPTTQLVGKELGMRYTGINVHCTPLPRTARDLHPKNGSFHYRSSTVFPKRWRGQWGQIPYWGRQTEAKCGTNRGDKRWLLGLDLTSAEQDLQLLLHGQLLPVDDHLIGFKRVGEAAVLDPHLVSVLL